MSGITAKQATADNIHFSISHNISESNNKICKNKVSTKDIIPSKSDSLSSKSSLCVHNPIERLITKTGIKSTTKEENKVILNTFPGSLHISIKSLEKFDIKDTIGVYLLISGDNVRIETEMFIPDSYININRYFTIPIKSTLKNTIKIKITMVVLRAEASDLSYETYLIFNNEIVENIHNKLHEMKSKLVTNTTSRFSKFFKKLYSKKDEGEVFLKAYSSFISDDDISVIPENLLDLCKWIAMRKLAHICFYRGYLNVKGMNNDYRWTRRYIKWYGYTLYIFDANTDVYIGSASLFGSIPVLNNAKYGIMKFLLNDHCIELHSDTNDSLIQCMEAINMI